MKVNNIILMCCVSLSTHPIKLHSQAPERNLDLGNPPAYAAPKPMLSQSQVVKKCTEALQLLDPRFNPTDVIRDIASTMFSKSQRLALGSILMYDGLFNENNPFAKGVKPTLRVLSDPEFGLLVNTKKAISDSQTKNIEHYSEQEEQRTSSDKNDKGFFEGLYSKIFE